MFIQTEQTPNPNSLKFLPGKPVYEGGSLEFADVAEAKASPLANDLFKINGITGVFLGADFITVTKTDEKEWLLLKPPILAAIMEFYLAELPLVDEVLLKKLQSGDADQIVSDMDQEIVSQIQELLDTRVRPAVAMDGGDIEFHSFEAGTVYLKMKGACSGCPSSTATLKMGVQNMLQHFVPEVKNVEAIAPE